MVMRKAKVNNKILEVMTEEEYVNKAYPVTAEDYVAVEKNGILYPVRGRLDNGPGLYSNGTIAKYIKPPEDKVQDYSTENIIDFTDAKTISEVIEKSNQLKNTERTILTNVDNVFVPKIGDKDTPEMVGLKQAVIKKNFDIESYKQRFGSNYNNDTREFDKSNVSFGKLRRFCDILDMKATLIIEDKEDAPNPIGEQIIVNLTQGE